MDKCVIYVPEEPIYLLQKLEIVGVYKSTLENNVAQIKKDLAKTLDVNPGNVKIVSQLDTRQRQWGEILQ